MSPGMAAAPAWFPAGWLASPCGQGKTDLHTVASAGSSAVATRRKSSWLIAAMTARRTPSLLNGGWSVLNRRKPIQPTGSVTPSAMPGLDRSAGSRSATGRSIQSTSLFCNAAMAVAESGMTRHSMRSTRATLPPEVQSGGSGLGR